MKLTDFSIKEITLTHNQAIALKQRVVDGIENYGLENFETKREIQLSFDKDDILDVYVTCEIYTDYKGSFQSFNEPPEPDEILSRSVMKLIIQLINKDGDEVEYKVTTGEDFKSEIDGKWYTKQPIDIEEEVKNHFSI